jgi:hypothetical protein
MQASGVLKNDKSRMFREICASEAPRQKHCQGPVCATLVAGALVLLSIVALPFASLLRLSTAITLPVFALVSLSLWRIQQCTPHHDFDFHVPRWVPIAAALGSTALIAAQFAFAWLVRCAAHACGVSSLVVSG